MKRTATEVQYCEDHLQEEHLSQKQLLERWSLLNIAPVCGISTKQPNFQLDLGICSSREEFCTAQVVTDSDKKNQPSQKEQTGQLRCLGHTADIKWPRLKTRNAKG